MGNDAGKRMTIEEHRRLVTSDYMERRSIYNPDKVLPHGTKVKHLLTDEEFMVVTDYNDTSDDILLTSLDSVSCTIRKRADLYVIAFPDETPQAIEQDTNLLDWLDKIP